MTAARIEPAGPGATTAAHLAALEADTTTIYVVDAFTLEQAAAGVELTLHGHAPQAGTFHDTGILRIAGIPARLLDPI